VIRRLTVLLLVLSALGLPSETARAGVMRPGAPAFPGAATAAAGTPAAAAPGVSIGVRLLTVPTDEANDPRAYEYIVDHVRPGTTIRRQFQVSDLGSAAAAVSVYAAAASVSGGSIQFAPGTTKNALTTWVSVSSPVLSLRPHQSVTETATIAVPPEATGGEQYGVIWAQVGGLGHGNIELVSRVGIRMYISVGPGGAPPSSFTLGPASGARVNGRPVLLVPVRNTGGLAVDIVGSLSLSDGPGGLHAGPFRADSLVTLAPGQAGTDAFTLPAAVPNGPWAVLVTLQSGLIVHSAQYTVSFAGTGAPAQGFPWALTIGLTAAAAAAIVLLLIIRYRRPRGGRGAGPGSPAPAGHGSGGYA
jgi:hypothetical protein